MTSNEIREQLKPGNMSDKIKIEHAAQIAELNENINKMFEALLKSAQPAPAPAQVSKKEEKKADTAPLVPAK